MHFVKVQTSHLGWFAYQKQTFSLFCGNSLKCSLRNTCMAKTTDSRAWLNLSVNMQKSVNRDCHENEA